VREVPLGECCEVVSGGTPKTADAAYWDGHIPWATPKDLSELGFRYIDQTARNITGSGLAHSGAQMLPPRSVLLSSRAPIGLVAINTVPMATNQGFKSLVPDPTHVDASYLAWWLQSHTKRLQAMGNGATFKEISKSTVARLKIPLPPLGMQHRIAQTLDKADGLRERQRMVSAGIAIVTFSTFRSMFGDPVAPNARWEKRALNEVTTDIRIGPFGTALHRSDYVENGVPVINPMHIGPGGIRPDPQFAVSDTKHAQLQAHQLREGDIVLGRRGEMGRCSVVESQHAGMLCGTGSMILRPDTRSIDATFLQAVLSSPSMRDRLARSSSGVTMANLNKNQVGSQLLSIPPLQLQARYAQLARRVRALAERHISTAARLDELFASLQHRAFAGEL
jgi:type I restriction enzyme S subunit